MNIILPTPSGFSTIRTDIIPQDIPLLIGLDSLDKIKWNFLTVENSLQSVPEGWNIPLSRKLGHIYMTWKIQFKNFFSKAQLTRIHKHMFHPSSKKLYEFLNKASPEQMTTETKSLIEDITKSCHPCQSFAPKAITFQRQRQCQIQPGNQIRPDVSGQQACITHNRLCNQLQRGKVHPETRHNHSLEHFSTSMS